MMISVGYMPCPKRVSDNTDGYECHDTYDEWSKTTSHDEVESVQELRPHVSRYRDCQFVYNDEDLYVSPRQVASHQSFNNHLITLNRDRSKHSPT